jgi:putative transposase
VRCAKLIEAERVLWPAGKEKIAWRLQRYYGVTVSASTVGRVIAELLRRGRVHRIGYAPKQAQRRARAARTHARRQARGERASAPGQLVQIDTLEERSDGRVRYHFSAIDPIARCAHARLYANRVSRNAEAFLRECLERWPSTITSVQVDNGSEFMGAFEQACQELGIELVTIAPRSPKRNAKVERLQRTFRDEHYAYEPPHLSLSDANEHLDAYLHYYNHQRPHRALRLKTPMAYAHPRNPHPTGQPT